MYAFDLNLDQVHMYFGLYFVTEIVVLNCRLQSQYQK